MKQTLFTCDRCGSEHRSPKNGASFPAETITCIKQHELCAACFKSYNLWLKNPVGFEFGCNKPTIAKPDPKGHNCELCIAYYQRIYELREMGIFPAVDDMSSDSVIKAYCRHQADLHRINEAAK